MVESPKLLLARIDGIFKKKEPAIIALCRPFETLWAACKFIVAQGVRKDEQYDEKSIASGLSIEEFIRGAMTQYGVDEFLTVARALYRVAEPPERQTFKEGLRRHILDEIGAPNPIGLDELWRLADEHLPISDEVFGDSVEDLKNAVRRKFRRLRISRRQLVASADAIADTSEADGSVLWSNDWMEIELSFGKGVKRAHVRDFALPKQFQFSKVYARVIGWLSPAAARAVSVEVVPLVQAALWAASDLETPGGASRIAKLPSVTPECLRKHTGFARALMVAYFASRRAKDETTASLRNAAHLMVQAALQAHDAVALVLYCSAIEALLSRGKESITKSLSEDVAVLLEPEEPARRPDAMGFVSELYNLRSRSLHGDGLSGDPLKRGHARALATHVLNAILERQAFDNKLGTHCDRSALLKELQTSRVAGSHFVGVTPSSIRSLWRTKS